MPALPGRHARLAGKLLETACRIRNTVRVKWSEHCAAVIPCLNEAESIGSLVEQVRRVLPAVFVIDDGSSDQTGQLAAAAGAKVLCHQQPCGKGAALNSGWSRAQALGFQW